MCCYTDVYIPEEYVSKRRREKQAAAAAAAANSGKTRSERVAAVVDSSRVSEMMEQQRTTPSHDHQQSPLLGFRLEKKFLAPGGLSESTVFNCLAA